MRYEPTGASNGTFLHRPGFYRPLESCGRAREQCPRPGSSVSPSDHTKQSIGGVDSCVGEEQAR